MVERGMQSIHLVDLGEGSVGQREISESTRRDGCQPLSIASLALGLETIGRPAVSVSAAGPPEEFAPILERDEVADMIGL